MQEPIHSPSAAVQSTARADGAAHVAMSVVQELEDVLCVVPRVSRPQEPRRMRKVRVLLREDDAARRLQDLLEVKDVVPISQLVVCPAEQRCWHRHLRQVVGRGPEGAVVTEILEDAVVVLLEAARLHTLGKVDDILPRGAKREVLSVPGHVVRRVERARAADDVDRQLADEARRGGARKLSGVAPLRGPQGPVWEGQSQRLHQGAGLRRDLEQEGRHRAEPRHRREGDEDGHAVRHSAAQLRHAGRDQKLHRALGVRNICQVLLARHVDHLANHGRNVVVGHLVEGEVPELVGVSGVGAVGPHHAEGVAPVVAQPHVIAGVVDLERQPLERAAGDPSPRRIQDAMLQQHCRGTGPRQAEELQHAAILCHRSVRLEGILVLQDEGLKLADVHAGI
mmetsp:Transcript_82781/g.213254  ORF Transcript_82781/g.213254 Transcript_82781/m.213254 type:complete len:395 (+) Transcript_82781:86-1270(+)